MVILSSYIFDQQNVHFVICLQKMLGPVFTLLQMTLVNILSVPYSTIQSVSLTSLQCLHFQTKLQISAVDVDDIIFILDSAKATGCDGIFNGACIAVHWVTDYRIINQSTPWKCAVVTPVQKTRNSSAQFQLQFFKD